MSDALSLLPGSLFHGRYRVVRCIKRGGMGAVFEVLDERTDSRRALKTMRPDTVDDDDLRGRFAREVRVTGAIESDHVVRVSDGGVDEASGTPFLVMELLRGSDLGALLRDAGRIAPGDTVRYLGQAALGLERAHAAGIVHRDLKPENLFLTRRDDGSPCVKVLDFGIAKIVARRTQAKDTRTMGTPTYMAPEQIRGEGTTGPAADVYALGLIAYALLVGQDYWTEEASRAASMFSFFSRVVQGLPEAPAARAARTRGVTLGEAFDAWLLRAAAPRPEGRFAGAGAAVAALAAALGVETPPGLSPEADPTHRDAEPVEATTLTTEVDPSQAETAALDTVSNSVWSQTATKVSTVTTGETPDPPARPVAMGETPIPPAQPGAPLPEATPPPEVAAPTPLASAAPFPARRPLPRRVVGSLGAAAVAGAIAWGALGTWAPPPVPAPEVPGAAAAPHPGDPSSAPPSLAPTLSPPGAPAGRDGGAPQTPGPRTGAAKPPQAARSAASGNPRPSATAPPSQPGLPGLF